MNKESAFDILENIAGGTDESTSYGEAVAFIRKLVEGQKPSTNSAMVPLPHNEVWISQCESVDVPMDVAMSLWIWLQRHQ